LRLCVEKKRKDAKAQSKIKTPRSPGVPTV
jgi:hypothetical protein